MKLSVIVVNWNTVELLPGCLDSVCDEIGDERVEIIVVDNGSTDGSLELLADRYPEVTVIANEQNRGYQAACNQGYKRSTGELMLHLNSDARLQPGALKAMSSVLDTWPRIGVVGPRLVYGDGSFQRWTAGQVPSLRAVAWSFLIGDRLAGGRGVWAGTDRSAGAIVGWVSSACLLVRRRVFDDIGGLDERFFAYMDDVDLCSRAAAAGWTTWYEPSACAVHFMGGSQEHPGSAASPVAIEALVRWFSLHHGRREARRAAEIMAAGFALRTGAHGIRAAVGRSSLADAHRHLRHARVAFGARNTP